MEQVQTGTVVEDKRIPGVPSDASALKALRRFFKRQDARKSPRPDVDVQQHAQATVDVGAHRAQSSPEAAKSSCENTPADNEQPDLPDTPNQSPATDFRQPDPAPSHFKTSVEKPLSTPDNAFLHTEPDLLTKSSRIRQILERVEWTRLRDDAVREIAMFEEFDNAEMKFQEFESFIRAEGKNLGLPEGCKPFERVLLQSKAPGVKPCPYIRFTNFRTEAEVRGYHAVLSKRKIRTEYYPPLRLCYEIQRLRFNAGNVNAHIDGDLGDTLCGKTAIIETGGIQRLVTIGGTIQIGHKLYAMTVGHLTSPSDDLTSSPDDETSVTNPFDGSEYDDDIESALICGGPNEGPKARDSFRHHENIEDRQIASRASPLRLYGSSMEGDDWSLHLLEDTHMTLPNSCLGIDGKMVTYMTHPAFQPVSGPVRLVAGVSGPRLVQMSPGTVSFPMPSGKWIDAWKISFDHKSVSNLHPSPSTSLQQGDSGSWVVDLDHGTVFGHVVASNDTSAFLMPLKYTLRSILEKAKMKATSEIILLPPAFDMLANLAHVHYIRSVEEDKSPMDVASSFASRALMPSALSQSPASDIAPVISACLDSYQVFQTSSSLLLQNVLMRTGADLQAGLASIWHNGQIESLLNLDQSTTSMEREAAKRLLLDLTVALKIQTTGFSKYLQDCSGVLESSKDGTSAIAWQTKLEPNEITRAKKSPKQSYHLQSHQMSGAIPSYSAPLDNRRDGAFRHILYDVPQIQEPERQSEKHLPPVADASRPHPPVFDEAFPSTPAGTKQAPGSSKRSRRRLGRLPLWAVVMVIVFVLILAVIMLGVFLGLEVNQKQKLAAELAKSSDELESCQITVTISVIACSATTTVLASTTETSSTATSATNSDTGSDELSSGAIAGIVLGVVFALVFFIGISLTLFFRGRRAAG